MPRITRRLIDAHLHVIKAHPTLLPADKLQKLIKKQSLHQHVEDLVKKDLLQCAPKGPNPSRMRGDKTIQSAYSALQYITRQDLQTIS